MLIKKLEAWAGIEPAIELLQSSALPLGYHAVRESEIGRLLRFAIVRAVSSRILQNLGSPKLLSA